ncbi:hypothetical protein T265_00386 [Opisthorchis viverrini]|uniref:Uncharacterized protein n=1 Tax=Opisthorchis viverrini TaxID=6198 RepID=A0A075AJT7_OPIVI|nr:hypothetical protein T265_00386 [Opisthorchis viverrini]KER33954.1 hypothetical protein T265_00386 [Opisthorchis viverrini]
MGRYLSAVSAFASGLLEYETQKVVQIHSLKVGITFRLIQLGIILYVVVWVMIFEKGYQQFDHAVSGVTAKLKGIAFANVTDNPAIGASVWDAADYVIPPQQNSAFFVMTNLVSTPGQSLGRCEESHDVYGNNCSNDTQCTAGHLVMTGSGVQTGRCVPSTRQKGLKVCEIYGWCPTEHDITPKPHLLASAENFTVMLKNSIEFPRYRVKRRNILKWMDKLFLKTCRYNPNDERLKFCPIFRLGDILKYSDAQNKNLWQNGGMVSIHIEWTCNLDFDVEKCVPKYVFRRLDDFESPVAKGWNFRFSQHYMENGTHKRNLIKAHGIQFFITVYGKGGKFNIIQFSMNLGSGLALLGIATVLCDMIVLNTTRKRELYRKAKVDLIAQRKAKERLSKQIRELEMQKKAKLREATEDAEVQVEQEDQDPYKPNKNTSEQNLVHKISSGHPDSRLLSPKRVSDKCWTDETCVVPSTSLERTNQKSNHFPIGQPSLLGFCIPDANKPVPEALGCAYTQKTPNERPIPQYNSKEEVPVRQHVDNSEYIPQSLNIPFGPPTTKKRNPRF